MQRSEFNIQMADQAERQIANSMAQIAKSIAPSVDRTAGEIDLAHKLHLIDYARREELMSQLRVIVNRRREQLHGLKIEHLLRAAK